MTLHNWIESNVHCGRRPAGSKLPGTNSECEQFLQGESLGPMLSKAAVGALPQAAAGVCLGILGASLGRNRLFSRKTLASGMIGGAIGFGASSSWRTRNLAATMGRGAVHKLHRVREERWLKRHPIDYA